MGKSRNTRRILSWFTSGALALLITCQAQGAVVFNLGTNFQNSTLSSYPIATLVDEGTDQVLLTMSSEGLDRPIPKWFFNVKELDDPIDSLQFVHRSGPEADIVVGRTQDENLEASGEVFFNIAFDFGPKSFVPDTEVIYLITGTGLNADAFAVLSAGPSGNGRPAGFYSAAHIPGNGSSGANGTWVGATELSEAGNPTPLQLQVPEPATLTVWGVGICLAFVGFMYRRRKTGSATSV